MTKNLPISQLLIGIFAIFISYYSIANYDGFNSFGAGFMPSLLGIILGVLCLVDALVNLKNACSNKEKLTAEEIKALMLLSVSILLFVFLVSYAGFVVCATLLMFGLLLVKKKEKKILSFVFSLGAALLINYIFSNVLMVALPTGFWS